DQTYALWAVSQDAFRRTLFPLGNLTKPEVRSKASALGLSNAAKQESFEICFVADYDHGRFLGEKVPGLEQSVSGGRIVRNGKEVGTHRGYPFYTIGQRKGIGAFGEKVYVTEIDKHTNTLTIGSNADLLHRGLVASEVNWISTDGLKSEMRVTAKVRYKDDASQAVVKQLEDGRIQVKFDEPKRAVTPGQSVVLYDGDDVVGGGIIEGIIS
ncbi:MAG: tRNA 2-thiouridine(34) synthase MnmA, partial [Proteobacteria bacterium]|nr:tRNA 2-thiouridine(34) synthase MnmA [Pseudomonadota bacterium]